MTLELQVLTGSRAGANLKFDKNEVTVGRHASSDLRFDPQGDLDVSTRHAELREMSGTWTVVDEASTNGTYVNGVRVQGSKTLKDGDVINFGVNGPRVEVVSGAGARTSGGGPPATMLNAAHTPGSSARVSPNRLDTGVRVAIAVKEQTSAMKKMFTGALAVLVVLAVTGFVWTMRQSKAREAEFNASLAHGDSAIAALQGMIAKMSPRDSSMTQQLMSELERKKAELATARSQVAQGGASKSTIDQLSRSMAPMLSVGQMDVPRIREANDAAVVFIVADLDGTNMGGTGFAVTARGAIITNKHVVTTEAGGHAKRLAVKFANTKGFKPAHIVRVSETDDLALIQLDEPGITVPFVAGVSKAGARANVGSPVVTIGYPLSNDTPMDGEGMNFVASTTTTLGTVSKRLDNVLQLDSFSAHGASGSPVFDAEGNVVGVIYGGVRDSGGRIVLAVPAQRLAAFLGPDGAAVLK